mgnify:CR=1 FL=1
MNRPDPPPIQKQNSMIFFQTEKEANLYHRNKSNEITIQINGPLAP